ncbi:hypothetical protein GCM10022204_26450 [Microlunatus aurantiacus]|uniref:DUF4878 domain-containing protein n=1 Tax=Microlunatus aurantiacus TaxID=446786 RepID=A0ABP7DPA7_9ACTN
MSRRAVVLVAALAAIIAVLAAVLAWTFLTPAEQVTPVTTPSAPAPSPTSFNPSAGDAGAEDHANGPAEVQEAAWGPVVDRFATNFTNTDGGKKAWRQRLIGNPAAPNVTTDVAKQLDTVDIRNVPDGRYEGREVLKSSDYDLAVKVTYREGWAMVLYLITDGTGWQIYAYDKWEA